MCRRFVGGGVGREGAGGGGAAFSPEISTAFPAQLWLPQPREPNSKFMLCPYTFTKATVQGQGD